MCSTDAMFISLEIMFASIVVRRSVETLCSESKDVFLLERSGKYNEHSLKWAHCNCAVFEAGLALFKGYNGGLTFRSNADEVMFMWNQRIFHALRDRLPSCRKNGGSTLWLEVLSHVPWYLSKRNTMNLGSCRLWNCWQISSAYCGIGPW